MEIGKKINGFLEIEYVDQHHKLGNHHKCPRLIGLLLVDNEGVAVKEFEFKANACQSYDIMHRRDKIVYDKYLQKSNHLFPKKDWNVDNHPFVLSNCYNIHSLLEYIIVKHIEICGDDGVIAYKGKYAEKEFLDQIGIDSQNINPFINFAKIKRVTMRNPLAYMKYYHEVFQRKELDAAKTSYNENAFKARYSEELKNHNHGLKMQKVLDTFYPGNVPINMPARTMEIFDSDMSID